MPRASSAAFNKVGMSGWVDMKPSAHLLPPCCVPVLPGLPDGEELPSLHHGLWGTSALLLGEEAVANLAGGIFFVCMVNSNNMSFIAQNVSTFMGCYI